MGVTINPRGGAAALARIAVLGDAIHDVYLEGDVLRLSPEAPVPVLLNPVSRQCDGGAANVAAHLRELGHDVTLYTLPGWPIKTRYCTRDGHHLLRVDVEHPPKPGEQDHLWDRFAANLYGYDALVISDYHKGSVSQTADYGDPLLPEISVADAKVRFHRFSRFTAVKGNANAGDMLWGQMRITTLGPDGCDVNGKRYPGHAVPVADVTGAGDTFTAWLTHGLLLGQDQDTIITNCNRAAALAVQHRGTTVIASLA
jgi:bifunctional ADP-heptose synthase (sugar kinase/adenylyltransferase)